MLSIYSGNGQDFYIGLTDGLVDTDGRRHLNENVNALNRYDGQIYIGTQTGLYRMTSGAEPIRCEEVTDAISTLKLVNGKLYALGMDTVYRISKDEIIPIASHKDALFTDITEMPSEGFLLVSYNDGIWKLVDEVLERIVAVQERYVSILHSADQTYIVGREGLCQLYNDSCVPLTAEISGGYVANTETGAYIASSGGVWSLDLNFSTLKPTVNYVLVNNQPIVRHQVDVNSDDTLTLVFNKNSGFVEISGETYPIYDGTVSIKPTVSFNVGNFHITVLKNWGWLYSFAAVSVLLAFCAWSLKQYQSRLKFQFAETCRDRRKNDAIRSTISYAEKLSRCMNENSELSLASAAQLTDELTDIVAPMRISARLRTTDNLKRELDAAMVHVKYANNVLSAKVGKIDSIPPELNADCYEALLRMVSVSIDLLQATEVTVDVLHDDGVMLCVLHNGKTISRLRQKVTTNMHLIVAQHIGSLYGETLVFSPNEINLTLRELPAKPQQGHEFGNTSVSQIF